MPIFKFDVSVKVNTVTMFDAPVQTPNKTAIQDQLQVIEDGKRKANGCGVYVYRDTASSSLVLNVVLATCWQHLTEEQRALLQWLSICPNSLEVAVEKV